MQLDWRTDLGRLLLLATLLLVAALLRRLPRFLPSRRARMLTSRWLLPAVELAIAALVSGSLLILAARATSTERVVIGVLLVVGAAWAFRSPLQDFASGITLRMDGLIEPGTWIRAAGVEGRVRRVGYRSVEIETAEGTRLGLPFTLLAAGRIERSPEARAARAHTFTVEVTRTRPLDRLFRELPAFALLSPWTSPVRLPEVRLLTETERSYLLEVTATAIDPAFASRIEATVRSELARSGGVSG